MAQITLVYPDYTQIRLHSNPARVRTERGGWYAEGLAALSAALRRAGHSVHLIHITQPPTRKSLVTKLTATHPDVIGFTVRTSAFPSVAQWTSWTKDALTVPVAWGGYHASLAPQQCLAIDGLDAVLQ